jgi:hypothetical protein
VVREPDAQRGVQTIDQALDDVFAATERALKKLIGAMSVLKKLIRIPSPLKKLRGRTWFEKAHREGDRSEKAHRDEPCFGKSSASP